MAEQAVMTTRRGMVALTDVLPLDFFDVVEDIVDGTDGHGRFLFRPGQRETQHQLDLAEQLNGVDGVKAVVIAQVVVQAGRIKFKVIHQDPDDFFLQFFSFHGHGKIGSVGYSTARIVH